MLLGVKDHDLEAALRDRASMPDHQISEVREASDWFWRARTWLHLEAGRCSDVLITNYQDRIARELGGGSTQDWLSTHLTHAENLARFRVSAVRTLLQGPVGIDGIRLENGRFHLQDKPSDSNAVVNMFLSKNWLIIDENIRG